MRELQVVEMATDQIVHKVDVSGKTERAVERIERGMLINMDHDRFFVRDTGPETEPNTSDRGAP